MTQGVLVVIDMQNDFVSGVLGSQAAAAVVGPVRKKVAEYAEKGLPVYFTMDTHTEEEFVSGISQEGTRIPRHCVRGTPGWKLVPELGDLPGIRVEKGSFGSLNLSDIVGEDPLPIELCGVCTDICVVSNALLLRAHCPNRPIGVDAACCAGTSAENHEAALRVMKSCLIDIL